MFTNAIFNAYKSRYKRSSGYTLLELVFVIILLGLSLPVIMVIFGRIVEGSADSLIINQAVGLVSDSFEEIRQKRWDEDETLPAGDGTVVPGAEAMESRATFDDVDDFAAVADSPPADSQGNQMAFVSAYSRSSAVCYVEAGDLDTCVAGPTAYKKITVSVDTPDGNRLEAVNLAGNWR